MDYLPAPLQQWIQSPSRFISSILPERFSKLDLSTAGGLYLYGLSFIMLFVPIAILGFESISKRWQAYLNAEKPPLPPPTTITELRIYPVKSCRGIVVPHAKLLRTGLELDRNWMFVDASTKKFLTIRENAQMTLINTSISKDGDEITVDASEVREDAKFTIKAHPERKWLDENTELITVIIWGVKHDAWAYPASMTAPFEEIFGRKVSLVLKGPTPRPLGANGAPKHLGREQSTMFPDMAPVLVANEQSIAELNERVKTKGVEVPELSIERFRPNIIVQGTEAWNEDVWKTLKITTNATKLVLNVTSRCARCQVPNVEPSTGEAHKKEPWSTLMSYRRIDWGMKWKPCFGMLCAPKDEGEIKVGDAFEVTDTTNKHRIIMGFS